MADMKKLTAQNEAETGQQKKHGLDDMRAMPVDGTAKKSGPGPRFHKVTGTTSASRFKKVGSSSKAGEGEVAGSEDKDCKDNGDQQIPAAVEAEAPAKVIHLEEDEIHWEEHPLMAQIRAGGDPWEGHSAEAVAELQNLAVRCGLE